MTDPAILAWEVEINAMRCIVFAATRDKAKWVAVKAYREAYGGGRKEWPNPAAVRAPRFESSLLRNEPPRAWSESYVAETI